MTRVLHYADLESAYDDPERIGRLAGLVRSRRDGETIVVGSGDNTGPGVLALKTNGRQSLDFFRAVDPDADTFGNHEFDYEPETTRGLVRESPQTWVCANAFDGDEPFAVEEGVVPWTVVGTTSSQVGVFGVASPDTGDISPPAASLSFTDPIDAARDAVAALRERDVDRVLGLSHCGDDDDLAAAIEADAICGGHYHEPREDIVADTLVVRPGASGEHLVEVDLDTDRPTATWHTVTDGPLDEGVADRLRERMQAVGLDEVVTTLDVPIDRRPMLGETAVGNFMADAFRHAGETDVGLVHAGSVRDTNEPFVGEVTVGDLVSLLPFDNELVTLELSGRELRETARLASGSHLDLPDERWWPGHFSNVTIVWDHPSREFVDVTVGGEPIDDERTYTLTTFDYNITYDPLFPRLTDERVLETIGSQHDAMIAYAREFGIPTETDGRLIRHGLE